jgi:hypothetical protein
VRAAEAELGIALGRDSTYAPALSELAKLDLSAATRRSDRAAQGARAKAKELPQAIRSAGAPVRRDGSGRSGARGARQREGARRGGRVSGAARTTPEDGAPLAEQALKDDPKERGEPEQLASRGCVRAIRLRRGRSTRPSRWIRACRGLLQPRHPREFFALDEEAAAKAFGKYWSSSHDDPDRLAKAFGVNGVAEKKD